MKRSSWLAVSAIAVMVSLAACDNTPQTQRVPIGGSGATMSAAELPAELQMPLDSGNAAYRARDYEAALRYFGLAVERDATLAAGWYGLGMTHRAMGNQPAADSAMARVQRLAPGVPVDHPAGAAPPNPH